MREIRTAPRFRLPLQKWSEAIKSGLLPDAIKTPEQALIIALKGEELGLTQLQAFDYIYVVNGKPSISGELMLAQIYKRFPQGAVEAVECGDKLVKVRGRRNASDSWLEASFSIEQAKTAGLTGKAVWKSYPEDMLWWKAVARLRRRKFPDVAMGLEIIEDMQTRVYEATVVQRAQPSLDEALGDE